MAIRVSAMILVCAAFQLAGRATAQEATGSDNEKAKQRLALMVQTIVGFEARSDAILEKPALTFGAKPLLRYTDPTRGSTESNVLLDASVWRLGESGRPTALVTLEIYRASGTEGLLSYEFASLTHDKFTLRHKQNEKITWDATGSAVTMAALPGAPMPAKNATGRLTQMRQLARQFKVIEKLRNEQSLECRLLAQPIDRYSSAAAGITDGAIFAFANGTNPELGLLLECDTTSWSYGAVRLSAAETTVELGGKEVAHFPIGDFRSTSGTYSAAHHPLELPE